MCVEHALQLEVPGHLCRLGHGLGAEHPFDVAWPGHVLAASVHRFPMSQIAPCDMQAASRGSMAAGARGVVAAQLDPLTAMRDGSTSARFSSQSMHLPIGTS